MTFFLRRRWTRAASCTVLSVSAWRAGASDTWAIMVVRQLAVARVSRSSAVSLCSLGAGGARLRGRGPGRGAGGPLGLGAATGLEGGRRASSWTWAVPGALGSGLTPTSAPRALGSRTPCQSLGSKAGHTMRKKGQRDQGPWAQRTRLTWAEPVPQAHPGARTYLQGTCLAPLTSARMTLPKADNDSDGGPPGASSQLPRSMRCRRLRPPDTETTGWEVKAQPQGPQTQGARPHDAGTRPPTSASAALLHAVLIHVQREEHVGASPGVLAGGQCRVQVHRGDETHQIVSGEHRDTVLSVRSGAGRVTASLSSSVLYSHLIF